MLNAAEDAAPQGRLLRRNAARGAILQAGRRVAERDGIGAFSLSTVAAEAGFGPSTVFGHFRNKDELLLAIVTEDLAGMAALMRESAAPAPQSMSDGAGAYASTTPEHAAETAAETPAAEFAPSAAPEFSLPEPSSPPRPPVDAWLERRLRTFEHTLTDLEQRMKETEAGASWAVAISRDTAKSVAEKLDIFDARQMEALQSFTRRMEETEMRQRGATAEMRAAMNDTATRIEILESARRSDRLRAEPPADAADEAQAEKTSDTADARLAESPADEDYADAAQRATSAAALLADMDKKDAAAGATSPLRAFAGKRVRLSRRQYFIAGCTAALAFVFGAFFAFYVGVARGHELASAVAAKPAAPVHVAARPAPRRALEQKDRPLSAAGRLTMLAEQGDAGAQLLVGLKYLHGEGAAPDQPLAAQWIRRAAEQQQPMAQYWLATMYEHGDGVAADSGQAVRWYEAAAGQGNRKAMHALGVAYAEGRGASKDYSQAARWFTRAAALGLVNSQFNLGVLYERGLGVPQSLLDAYKWYAIAARQGDQESAARVEALKTQLNADDLAAAERAAANFQADAASPVANTAPVVADLGTNPAR